MKSSGSVQVRYTTQSGFQDNDKNQVLFRLGIQLNQFFLSITMAYKYGVPAFMAGQRHELIHGTPPRWGSRRAPCHRPSPLNVALAGE